MCVVPFKNLLRTSFKELIYYSYKEITCSSSTLWTDSESDRPCSDRSGRAGSETSKIPPTACGGLKTKATSYNIHIYSHISRAHRWPLRRSSPLKSRAAPGQRPGTVPLLMMDDVTKMVPYEFPSCDQTREHARKHPFGPQRGDTPRLRLRLIVTTPTAHRSSLRR